MFNTMKLFWKRLYCFFKKLFKNLFKKRSRPSHTSAPAAAAATPHAQSCVPSLLETCAQTPTPAPETAPVSSTLESSSTPTVSWYSGENDEVGWEQALLTYSCSHLQHHSLSSNAGSGGSAGGGGRVASSSRASGSTLSELNPYAPPFYPAGHGRELVDYRNFDNDETLEEVLE